MPIRSLQCRRWLAQRLGLSLSTLERQRTCCEHNPPPHVVIGWHAGTPRRQAAACGEARCHPCLVLLLHRRGVDASQGPSPRRPIEAIHRVRRRRERGLGLDCVPRGFGSSLIEPYPLRPDIDQTTKKPTGLGWLFLLQIKDLLKLYLERAMGIEPAPASSLGRVWQLRADSCGSLQEHCLCGRPPSVGPPFFLIDSLLI